MHWIELAALATIAAALAAAARHAARHAVVARLRMAAAGVSSGEQCDRARPDAPREAAGDRRASD